MKTDKVTLCTYISNDELKYLREALKYAIEHGFKVKVFSDGKSIAIQG